MSKKYSRFSAIFSDHTLGHKNDGPITRIAVFHSQNRPVIENVLKQSQNRLFFARLTKRLNLETLARWFC